ncbi:hypothetical protein SKAU_G00202590 [Synaphobranchus kaupii]|uniref:Uncharacterized protein n=1 Tax=Synaphobranchus kaupii TaxID=118154 RepID=A0A9Q1FFR9_SYNKA|nr:hypothetical protein SKAU_G00202590 [Synaphobranchus kaupii]
MAVSRAPSERNAENCLADVAEGTDILRSARIFSPLNQTGGMWFVSRYGPSHLRRNAERPQSQFCAQNSRVTAAVIVLDAFRIRVATGTTKTRVTAGLRRDVRAERGPKELAFFAAGSSPFPHARYARDGRAASDIARLAEVGFSLGVRRQGRGG